MDHGTHGREDEDGAPIDSDCVCRGTPSQAECSRCGCGFCFAAELRERGIQVVSD